MTKPKISLYTAYGSNLNLGQMKHRCPTAEVVGGAELEGYDLLFRGSRSSAVATVEPLEGGRVPVLLWKLKPQDKRALDIYEGWPSFYRKEIHEIELGGKAVPAMVYVMNDGHDYGEPSSYYYETIREGYESVGFPVDYLDQAVERCCRECFSCPRDGVLSAHLIALFAQLRADAPVHALIVLYQ